MDPTIVVWIAVGIIVVIAIIAVVLFATNGRRRAAHLEAERRKAARLREDAEQTDLARRRREAEAAHAAAAAKQADADALDARLESERLARESAARQADAQRLREDVDERLEKADAVDPDVAPDQRETSAPARRGIADETPPG